MVKEHWPAGHYSQKTRVYLSDRAAAIVVALLLMAFALLMSALALAIYHGWVAVL